MKSSKLAALAIVLLWGAPPSVAQTPPKRRATPLAPVANQTVRNQSLPLRRVVLYSNGVAYFERRGMVSGHAEIHLPFKQSQIDDVLKSMIVLDLGKGKIGAVSYNSSAPPSARLGEIPFSMPVETSGNGMAGVLKQLQGAQVAVTGSSRSATGAIVTIERRTVPGEKDKPATVVHTLVIASESGEITSFDLTDIRSVKLLDEGTRRDLNTFAEASSSVRRRDAKTIVVTSDGEGQREMVVSYTVAAPIWKTTYRVVMDSEGKPFFQGWAIVDNISEEDWENVSLSLVSGTPISFIQPLQQPLYRYRPVLPIADDVKLNPQGVPLVELPVSSGVTETGERRSTESPRPALSSTTSPSVQIASQNSIGVNAQLTNLPSSYLRRSSPATGISSSITGGESGVSAAAGGNEIGDLFEYKISQPVTVKQDRSALVPIVQEKLEGEKVSLYNETTSKERPLNGIRLLNNTKLTLESGILTIVDGDAYAGEGSLDRFKPGDRRFVTYAVDLGTSVTTKTDYQRNPVFLVRKNGQDLEIHYYVTEKRTYTVTNQTDRPKTVYLEHPKRGGWELTKDMGTPPSTGPTVNRFRLELEPRQTKEFVVSERQALMDEYPLGSFTQWVLDDFLKNRYVDETMREALQPIVERNEKISELEAANERADQEIEKITEGQSRLRENIETLSKTPEAKQLITRYVTKLTDQEIRVEELTKKKAENLAEIDRLKKENIEAVKKLVYERKF
ncbi:MAG: hypothetical protein K1Y36_03420 [Blastocatellia bacterium]|nr:hypothetical protein [Blastocatellia bacterium]